MKKKKMSRRKLYGQAEEGDSSSSSSSDDSISGCGKGSERKEAPLLPQADGSALLNSVSTQLDDRQWMSTLYVQILQLL
jgi:hypothetical protein